MIDSIRKNFEGLKIGTYKKGLPWKFAHLKRDGWCIQMYKDGKGELFTYTRKPKRIWINDDWYTDLRRDLPNDFVLFGELFVPDGQATDVASVVAGNLKGEFEAFYSPCVQSLSELSNYAPVIPCTEDISKIPIGYEGFVLKNDYHPGEWWKLKPEKTVDLRVIGFKPGLGKFAGFIGSAICKSDDGKISAVVGGMSDEVREHMTKYRKWWKGQIIEVEYQLITRDGALRHPRYKRHRPDKDTTE